MSNQLTAFFMLSYAGSILSYSQRRLEPTPPYRGMLLFYRAGWHTI